MKAMVMHGPNRPLVFEERPIPSPQAQEVLIRVRACAVCRTDLHVVEGDLPEPALPLIPGHEVIGEVVAMGEGVSEVAVGQRVGAPWLGWTCGTCRYCASGRENLCDQAQFNGYTRDGGFAEYMVADHRFAFPVPEFYSDAEAAPLMCAGLIGFRSLSKVGEVRRLGLYGFGAAAHIVIQLARHKKMDVYAFTKPGDKKAQTFARELGAVWAGGSHEQPPAILDAAIIFAPLGALVPAALKAVDKGGKVICAGIHMSDIPAFPYKDLWQERRIESVANLTREDGIQFLEIAPRVPVKTNTHIYPLEKANAALNDLRAGRFEGAAVLVLDQTAMQTSD